MVTIRVESNGEFLCSVALELNEDISEEELKTLVMEFSDILRKKM